MNMSEPDEELQSTRRITMSDGDGGYARRIMNEIGEALEEHGLQHRELLVLWPETPLRCLLLLKTREGGGHELQAAALEGKKWTISVPLVPGEDDVPEISQHSVPETPNVRLEVMLELLMFAHASVRRSSHGR